jgi:phosphatidylglycerophosphate synthase
MRWLWVFNGCILMQYITDMLDGEVGRVRQIGLIKWGFYMDHLLDYIFLSSIIIGYSFLLPPSYYFLTLLCLIFMAGFMVHSFLDFAITNNLKISCNQFGVSEARFLLILFNCFLMVFGKTLLVEIFPYIVLSSFLGLSFLVYTSQKVYQHIDALWQGQKETST